MPVRPALLAATLALAPLPALAQVPLAEREQGAAFRSQILEQFGGAYHGPGEAEVARVGRAMAVASGLSRDGADCTVTLLNSPVVNAFATPGCFVYVTRGLLAIIGDEAELASVIGHEIGHVAARHAQKRESRSNWAGLGAALAGLVTGSQTVSRLAQGIGQRVVLGYSRGQEYEADALGVRYLTRAGYSPFESAAMLRQLAANDALTAKTQGFDPGARVPGWARSHPLTADRVSRVTELARKTGERAGHVGADGYLARIDGMIWGDDPAQGFIDGRMFAHPGLRIAFTAPPGFTLVNTPQAVNIAGEGGKAQFGGARLRPGDDLGDYAAALAQRLAGGARAGALERLRVNGIEAAVLPLTARTRGGGAVDVLIATYRAGPTQGYHLLMLAPEGGAARFGPMVNSFRRLDAAEAAALRPRVVRVVRVAAGDSVASLAARMAFADLRVERFLALNGLAAGARLAVGQPVKLVRFAGASAR